MTDTYSPLKRTGKVHARNTVPFLADVLKAKERAGNGLYVYTEVWIVAGENQWQEKRGVDTVFYQHVRVTDNYTSWTITTTLIDPTEPYETDETMRTWQLRWKGEPNKHNVEGVPTEPI